MYNPSKYKYGNKTTLEIINLLNCSSSDTVYNTDRYKKETYDGDIFLNGDMIKLIAGTNISIGYGVKMSGASNTVQLSTNDQQTIGICAYSASTNNKIGVFVGGINPTRINDASTRTRFILPSANTGEFTDTATAAINVSGIILVSNASSGNYNCLFTGGEKF